jgi:peroxiredoxin
MNKMKKYILILLVCLPALVIAQGNSYMVQGSVGNFNAPATMYLVYSQSGKTFKDSAVLADGKFQFTGTCTNDCPQKAYLLFDKNGTGLQDNMDFKVIYLEEGKNTVKGNSTLAGAAVAGTKTNLENTRYGLVHKPIDDAMTALQAKQTAASEEEQKSDTFEKALSESAQAIRAQETIIIKKFIQENPNSFISLELLSNLTYTTDYAEIGLLFNRLTPAVKASADGKQFAETLSRLNATALGAIAPEFTVADTSGNMVSLSSFRGKYVLIDFWASWCVPCRQENPNVVKTFNRYKDQNFTIIGVSLDRPTGKESWLNAIHKDGLTWTQLSELAAAGKSKTAALYALSSIPSNFLLDPDGKIIAKNLRGEDLGNKLAEIFGKR